VYLKNGDVITGEIKNLYLGLLTFDMTGPGKISIKWEEVKGLKSDKIFEITLRQGQVTVRTVDSAFFSEYQIGVDDIVELERIKDKFLRRLSGDINIGFNYTKSSKILQFNLGSSLTYRIPKMEFTFKFNSDITNNASDSILTKKQDMILSAIKYFDDLYFVTTQIGWQQNTELGLSNRFLVNGAGGKSLLVNNHNRLLAAVGLSLNLEESIESSSYTNNVDGLLIVQYKRFFYSYPKFSLNTSFVLYPGLSDWGRVRTEFDFKISFEVVKDFSIGLSLYHNYDNKPPAGASSKNDYGVNFTLGYFFGK
jgi:hypothetical protein